MKVVTRTTSQTVIGSLIKEAEQIRKRANVISKSIISCNNKSLLVRLKREFESLENRRQEILSSAKWFKSNHIIDEVSIEFLIEVCRRSIKYKSESL